MHLEVSSETIINHYTKSDSVSLEEQ